MKVRKRDGKLVQFDPTRIKNAVAKAFIAVDGELTKEGEKNADAVAKKVTAKLSEKKGTPSVEEIQDLVERSLMDTSRTDVAKAYIIYREGRAEERKKSEEMKRKIAEKLNAVNVQNQNANVDERSFGGRMGEARAVITKQYALEDLISEMARKHHENNEIYIHDLDNYAIGAHNCLTIPFDKLLANGFVTRQTDVRPARSVKTAMQLVAVIFQLQSLCQFGGVSASHLDWTMVPYVRMSFAKHYQNGMKYIAGDETYVNSDMNRSITDAMYMSNPAVYRYAMDMTEKETRQAVEAMYHNLNTLQSRSGDQLPFTSINYGTCTLPEGRMIIRTLLEVSIDGLGALHRTSIFPCSIFQMMKGVNREPGDPNYDMYQLALRSTAQRLYPNYANCDWSGNVGYDKNDPRTYFSTMGCRTANGYDINGFGQLKDGRGNICPVTIILPTIAMYAVEKCGKKAREEEKVDMFIEMLDPYISDAKDMLIERFNHIASQPPESAPFMYKNGTMEGFDGKNVISALKHGTLAIGQLGLAEALQILIGCDHTEERGMQAAKRIEQLFKDRCAEFKQKYSLNFGVYFTPAETLCYTAMKRFQDKYGAIKDISDKEFFTNSMHVPVWKNVDPFEKIDIESQLTGFSSAGCITYVELDSGAKNNLKALETIVNYAMDHDVPYFAINVPNDMCQNCGYTDEIDESCPMCGSKNIQRLRRVTGLSN